MKKKLSVGIIAGVLTLAAIIADCGGVHELGIGDAIWTTAGEIHSVGNRMDENFVIYAIILPLSRGSRPHGLEVLTHIGI